MHGLRGVGKTVLLDEFRRQAERAEFIVVTLEGRDADGGPDAVRAKLARNLLLAGRKAQEQERRSPLKSALGSVASFSAELGVTGTDHSEIATLLNNWLPVGATRKSGGSSVPSEAGPAYRLYA